MSSYRLKRHKSPNTTKSPKPSTKKKTFDINKIAGSMKKRKIEQRGISVSDQDDHGELSGMSEGKAGGAGDDLERETSDLECETSDVMEQSNEHGTGDEDEASSEDDMNDSESDSQSNVDEIASTSCFDRHVAHIITNEEADKLAKSKWQYKWEMPATGMLMSKWVGTGECLPKEVSEDLACGINPKLYKHWLDIYKASENGDFDARFRFFFSLCNTYRDIMHCDKKPFYLKGAQEDSCIMDAYLMHALNHVFKTRDIVVKNDAKLTKHQEGEKEILTSSSSLDHGFTRPKVLLLLPLGSILFRVVKKLIHLTPLSRKSNVEHIDRFTKEFGADDVEEDDDEIDGSSKYKKPPKSKDFELLFSGNNNDHFMIGMKFTKRSIKLYSDFYSSDIIIASPLGLVTKIGEAEVEKEKDVDYLSSIEVLVIDHADVIAMQNWTHVNTVVEQLNRIPEKQHGTDVMRIRQWYLDGHASFYRQTLLLGSFANPDMNALFNRLCVNYEGKVKLRSEYKGVLSKVLGEVRQVYERFDASSIVDVDDSRLEYFSQKVYPKIKDSLEGGTMLFISSYFEFVRLRNFLKSQNASFCLLGEYTKSSDISRARVWFFEGQRKIMLYTERAHFYYRYKIRGVKNLIIYSLPERKEFYPEIINMLEGSNMTCNVIFSRFDQLKLERIVGTSSSKRMLSSDKDTFVFC
ncbi:U3 small nucleolar RNA-associated protein 25 isoform X2 [Iris pallida]|uniref:U3 small nucleolar RNA-associated protein 25 isoform X2 n=1 Tax=Iris pallida TaxID=29817 RepID=A0AAX6IFG8_IRIPA|nr:U3 small nucleolar RNA-associated protein 25 isoform X2 [Iris pallida]